MSDTGSAAPGAAVEPTAPLEAGNETTSLDGAGGESQAGVSSGDKAQITKDAIAELGAGDMDRLVTIKVNGKEEKLPLKEVLKISRMEKASQAKMQEAAQMRAQAEQVILFAKNNPKAFFQKTGIDPYEFAESTLAEKYEMMQMTPEQKRLMEYEQKVKQYEERETKEKQTLEHRQHTEHRAKMQGELEKDIVDAWKESGLPVHKYFGARISAEMLSSLAQKKAGYREEALQAKEAAAIVKEQVLGELRDILMSVAKVDPGAAQKLLGDELMKMFRDFDVKRVTGKSASQSNSNSRPPSGASAKAPKSMNEREWTEWFNKR